MTLKYNEKENMDKQIRWYSMNPPTTGVKIHTKRRKKKECFTQVIYVWN